MRVAKQRRIWTAAHERYRFLRAALKASMIPDRFIRAMVLGNVTHCFILTHSAKWMAQSTKLLDQFLLREIDKCDAVLVQHGWVSAAEPRNRPGKTTP